MFYCEGGTLERRRRNAAATEGGRRSKGGADLQNAYKVTIEAKGFLRGVNNPIADRRDPTATDSALAGTQRVPDKV